jgi:hypothetical protein
MALRYEETEDVDMDELNKFQKNRYFKEDELEVESNPEGNLDEPGTKLDPDDELNFPNKTIMVGYADAKEMGHFKIEERISDKSIVMTPKDKKPAFTLIWLHGFGVDIEKAKFPLSVAKNNMPDDVKIVLPRPPDNKEWEPISGLTYWYDSVRRLKEPDISENMEPCVADIVTRWD